MSIDAEIFHKLRWEYDKDDNTVCAEIFARSECEIEEGYLVKLVELMRDGFDCFILETEEIGPRYANRLTKDDMRDVTQA